jgi:hypothetical protein
LEFTDEQSKTEDSQAIQADSIDQKVDEVVHPASGSDRKQRFHPWVTEKSRLDENTELDPDPLLLHGKFREGSGSSSGRGIGLEKQ